MPIAPGYAELAPPPELARFVKLLWWHRIVGPPPPEGRRLLPDGQMNLVWVRDASLHVTGPQTRFSRPLDLPSLTALGITFHPGAAATLLRTPVRELRDDVVPLEAFDSGLAAALQSRLDHAPDDRSALVAFAEVVGRRLRRAEAPDPAVAEAVRLLDRPEAVVADVAERAFVSERQLQRRFAERVGYGPKRLQRILRLQRFIRMLEHPAADLAGAAALAGYADQSHVTRDARELTGLTPARLRTWSH